MRVALIRNVHESRSLSMPHYADSLRDTLKGSCDVSDIHLQPDLPYRIASLAGLRFQDYVGRFWSFPRQLRGLSAEIFHIVDHANAHLVRELDPARTVVTCHDLTLLKFDSGEIPYNGSRPLVATTVFRWSVKHLPKVRAVLCDSESTKNDVLRLIGCDRERLHVVYLGLPEDFRRIEDPLALQSIRERINWPLTILHVGKTSFHKNMEGVIEALGLLTPRLRDKVHLVKLGQDFSPAQRTLIRRRGLGERVHFLGKPSLKDLVLFYNVADLLLFPSLYEGFGWPPLEAMACGTPVVCSDRGSLKEVVEDAALIVDPDDPKAIARGIECVLTDSELRETLILRGFERAKRFSWRTTVERVLDIYEEIAGPDNRCMEPG